jgi:hypothetical protein
VIRKKLINGVFKDKDLRELDDPEFGDEGLIDEEEEGPPPSKKVKLGDGLWKILVDLMQFSEANSLKKYSIFELFIQRVNFLEILEDIVAKLVSSITLKMKS